MGIIKIKILCSNTFCENDILLVVRMWWVSAYVIYDDSSDPRIRKRREMIKDENACGKYCFQPEAESSQQF